MCVFIHAKGEAVKIKSTGFVRHMDSLRRITIPKGLRDEVGIKAGDEFLFVVCDDNIELIKNVPRCYLCGEELKEEGIKRIMGKAICSKCIQGIRHMLKLQGI